METKRYALIKFKDNDPGDLIVEERDAKAFLESEPYAVSCEPVYLTEQEFDSLPEWNA